MYNVALVQNQSEMAHYSHADARPILSQFDYGVALYTANNIDLLAGDLGRLHYDAVVLGSNALNDQTIRDTLCGAAFSTALASFLSKGKGLVIFHQLRLATLEKKNLGFLPETLAQLSARVRPAGERSVDGRFAIPDQSSEHPCLLYPEAIAPQRLKEHSSTFQSLPGLYWHYWDEVAASDWDILLADPTQHSDSPRALVIAAKQTLTARIVASSIPADWQSHRGFRCSSNREV